MAQLSYPPDGNNQKCEVTQYMGMTSVTVTYNSPDVHDEAGNDRTGNIWGKLVPNGMTNQGFGKSSKENPSPWRAGANENTTVTFSHDMQIGGKDVKAGTYGLFMITGENEWTVILSADHESWGSYFYNENNDVLRFNATPKKATYREYLTYEFHDRKLESSTLCLRWEYLQLCMPVEVPNIRELYVEQMRDDLNGSKGFDYRNWSQAANYCAYNNLNLEEALEWADYGIHGKWVGTEDYTSLSAKANVLMAMGRKDDAMNQLKKAIYHPTAIVFNVHGLGRKYIAKGEPELALQIFKWNAGAHPNKWPVNVGLMRGYSATGEYQTALKYAKKALKNVDPNDDLNKSNLEKSVKMLQEGKDIN